MIDSRIHNNLIAIACFLFLIGLSFRSYGQVSSATDTTEYHFWYSGFDARSMAMANATIADPLNFNGLYSNPGLLPFNSNMPQIAIHSGYNSRYNIFTQNITGLLLENDDNKLVLGTTLIHNGSAGVSLPNYQQLMFTQFNLDLAYGQMLTSSLSMGLKVNMNYGYTQSANLVTANTSVGIIYAPSSNLSYGLIYKGPGYQNKWLGAGLSYYRSGEGTTQVTRQKLPHRLEIGTTLRFPSLEKYPNFVLSLSNEKLFGKPGLVYRGGLEIYLLNNLVLRGGYFRSPVVQGGRAGLGLVIKPLKINYAYANNTLDQNGRTHFLSITLDI